MSRISACVYSFRLCRNSIRVLILHSPKGVMDSEKNARLTLVVQLRLYCNLRTEFPCHGDWGSLLLIVCLRLNLAGVRIPQNAIVHRLIVLVGRMLSYRVWLPWWSIMMLIDVRMSKLLEARAVGWTANVIHERNHSVFSRLANSVQHCLIYQENGKFGFIKSSCSFDTLEDLVRYYHVNSLSQHNLMLNTTLRYPVNSTWLCPSFICSFTLSLIFHELVVTYSFTQWLVLTHSFIHLLGRSLASYLYFYTPNHLFIHRSMHPLIQSSGLLYCWLIYSSVSFTFSTFIILHPRFYCWAKFCLVIMVSVPIFQERHIATVYHYFSLYSKSGLIMLLLLLSKVVPLCSSVHFLNRQPQQSFDFVYLGIH